MAKFHPERFSIKNYLDDLRATIPDYQRGYSWEQDQVGDFMDDLIDENRRSTGSEYFFGPVVVVDSSDGDERKQVIDGQQRLTTITIFLAVCRDIFSAISQGIADSEGRNANRIITDYIGSPDEDDLRLTQKGQGEKFFRTEIQTPRNFKGLDEVSQKRDTRKSGTKPAQNVMAHAYNQMLSRLLELATVGDEVSDKALSQITKDLMTTLLTHFFIIEISISNSENAFQIFQTLNARGKDLTSADLIKSNFFGAATTAAQSEQLKRCWQTAQTNLQTEDLTDYIRYLWNSQASFATKRNLYRKVINKFTAIDDILAFTHDIETFSSAFSQISDINPVESELADQIGKTSIAIITELNALNFHAYYPLVLALLKLDIAEAECVKIMRLVRQILFRNKILNGGTNWLEKLMANEAVRLIETKDPATIHRELAKKAIEGKLDDGTIKDALQRFDFSEDERLAKSLLRMVENHDYNGKERGVVLPSNSEIHLEHIMPRKPLNLEAWGSFRDEEERQRHLWSIGNLTLWYGVDNSTLKNADFRKKKAGEPGKNNGYQDSTVHLTQDLTQFDAWNRDTIDVRKTQLIDSILSL
ncbi:DUF262 domain-containing protein [Lacticaseibacillus absianus]|uniref:DUF262 domain-containing protein n=1 Tax=Lacticaseibacillus absianus TaxID=2729623 RepID=UPI0015C9F51A|nr:DUF262 domain-containing protein [Lacticaseibacillus absianus]